MLCVAASINGWGRKWRLRFRGPIGGRTVSESASRAATKRSDPTPSHTRRGNSDVVPDLPFLPHPLRDAVSYVPEQTRHRAETTQARPTQSWHLDPSTSPELRPLDSLPFLLLLL